MLARILMILGLLVVVWVGVGELRSAGVAQDYFAHAHGVGTTLANVSVDGVTPAVPPFWVVNISGDVIEAGRTLPSYRSYMSLWIEPFTGWTMVFGAG